MNTKHEMGKEIPDSSATDTKSISQEEIVKAIDIVFNQLDDNKKSVGAIFASQLLHQLDIKSRGVFDKYFWQRDDTDDMYIN